MVTKQCGKCKRHMPVSDFHADKNTYSGLQSGCKDCNRKKASIKARTASGVIANLYQGQKRNQKNRGHGEVPYSKEQFSKWVMSNGFDGIFNAWVNGGYNKDLRPSVDRVNDNKGYSFDNITLVTWKDNRLHQYSDILNGVGTSGARCKPVVKYDSEMNELCEYISLQSAIRAEGYSMQWSVENGTRTRKGHYWKYR